MRVAFNSHKEFFMKRSSPIWKVERDVLEKIVRERDTLSSILLYFGLINKGGNFKTLKHRLREDNIDFSHIVLGRAHSKGKRFPGKAKPLVEYMTENSSYNRSSLKKRMIAEGMMENKCYICGMEPKWNGKTLVMVLDHINGVWNDSRRENLRLLCPNCNSQQPTFAGRTLRKFYHCVVCGEEIGKGHQNCKKCAAKRRVVFNKPISRRKVIDRPSKEDLLKMVWEEPTTTIAIKFGVSGNAVGKWCKKYGITKPSRGYWAKRQSERLMEREA